MPKTHSIRRPYHTCPSARQESALSHLCPDPLPCTAPLAAVHTERVGRHVGALQRSGIGGLLGQLAAAVPLGQLLKSLEELEERKMALCSAELVV